MSVIAESAVCATGDVFHALCNNVTDVKVAGQGMGSRSRNVTMLENR